MTNAHEEFCLLAADHFTAVRGRNGATRQKAIFQTMEEAEKFAASFGDRKTMIYAVTKLGHSAHIKNA